MAHGLSSGEPCIPDYPPPPPSLPPSRLPLDPDEPDGMVAELALDEVLAKVPAQAILDALAAKSRAELGRYREDLSRIGEKIGKKLVPFGNAEHADSRDGCATCNSVRARCDGKRPCGRCISRGNEALCAYASDPDFVPRRKQRSVKKQQMHEEPIGQDDFARQRLEESSTEAEEILEAASQVPPPSAAVQRKRPAYESTRPIRREGVTASGDILCMHGVEKRNCLHETCVADGGGKAMCQHGRRRRICKEPECKRETERRRLEIESRRCEHGRQKRLCREGNCLKEFPAAIRAYRDSLLRRKTCGGDGTTCVPRLPRPTRTRPACADTDPPACHPCDEDVRISRFRLYIHPILLSQNADHARMVTCRASSRDGR
jgi:hypothetical protein